MTDTVRVSIIVPAYKEVLNLPALIQRVFAALKSSPPTDEKNSAWDAELIVVDDNSKDGSKEAVENEANGLGRHNARIIVREKERGLSSAVLRGFAEAKGDYLLCMDADLQHPPEKVPDLLRALVHGAEFVLGTRYGPNVAIDKDWPLYRRVISKGARLLAYPLTPLSDPMTGFFGLSRAAYTRGMSGSGAAGINPIGFKIAMEMYVKCRITSHAEVPFTFGIREFGVSKLDGKVIVQYLSHLNDLYTFQGFKKDRASLFMTLSVSFITHYPNSSIFLLQKRREVERINALQLPQQI